MAAGIRERSESNSINELLGEWKAVLYEWIGLVGGDMHLFSHY
jgi:hypothetical protein